MCNVKESQLLSHSLSHLTFVKIIVYDKSLILFFISDFLNIISLIRRDGHVKLKCHSLEIITILKNSQSLIMTINQLTNKNNISSIIEFVVERTNS
jgi:hypothetical protein